MPGLCGLIAAAERLIERPAAILESFRRVNALQCVHFLEAHVSTPNCVILHLQTGLLKSSRLQPAWTPNHDVCLFLEGEIFNLEEVCQDVGMVPTVSPCETLLALYLKHGLAIAPRLDGQFNLAIYWQQENRLTIINDRFSSKPLYYCEENGGLLFGSEKKSILAVRTRSPAIDPVGLLQIFAYRHNLTGRTFIDGLSRLPPSSELQYHDNKLVVRRYETLRFEPSSPTPKLATLIETWGEALKTDLKRRVRGKERVMVSLSGGLDSRAFTCAIPRDFRPLWARTRGPRSSLEVVCAQTIAARLGLQHLHEDPEDVPYSELVARAVWRTECEVNFTHCFSIAAHEKIKQHADFLFAGQSGEIVAGGHIYPYMFVPRSRRRFIEIAHDWYLLYPERKLRQVFNPDFLARTLPDVKATFISSFDGYDGDNNIDAYQTWDLLERQARMTLSAGPVDSHILEKVYALLGRTYTDHALRLPVHLRYGQTLYQCMIRWLGPEIVDVPYANTNLRLRQTILGNLLNKGVHLARRGCERALHKILPVRSPGGPAPAGSRGHPLRSDPAFHALIVSFLGSSHFDPDIFNRTGIERLLADEYGGGPSQEGLLCLLATFAVGLPYLVHTRPSACPAEAEPFPMRLSGQSPADNHAVPRPLQ